MKREGSKLGRKLSAKPFFAIGIVLVTVLTYMTAWGFFKMTDVMIMEHQLSPDGQHLQIKTAVASSMGYTRSVKAKNNGDGTLELTFYRAFGGPNGSIGARNSFDIELDGDIDTIAVLESNGTRDILQKNPLTGEWMRVIKTSSAIVPVSQSDAVFEMSVEE